MSDQSTPSTSSLSIVDDRLFENKAGDRAILVRLTPDVVKTALLHSTAKDVFEDVFEELETYFTRFVVSGHDATGALDVIEAADPNRAVYVDSLATTVGASRVDAAFDQQARHAKCIVYASSSTEACITMPLYLPSRSSICKAEQLANTYDNAGEALTATLKGRKREHLNFTMQCANNQLHVIGRLLTIPALTVELKDALILRRVHLHKQLRRLSAIEAMHVNGEEV